MSRRRDLPPLPTTARAQALTQRGRRLHAATPEAGAGTYASESAPSWYHVGPVHLVPRAEVVGEPSTDPATDPAGDPAAETATATSADVYVYDAIGGWTGVTADDFVRDVAALDVEQIVLHVNSPGGDAWDGVAMANVLRQHRARVVVRVDGVAASAASVLAMAGDEVVMGLGTQLMIHDAWTYAMGNAAEMSKIVASLDSISNALAGTYAARAGGTPEAWREIMRGEAWYTAEEAVAAGLADRVATADDNATASGQQVVPGQSSYADDWWWDSWDSLRSADRHDLSIYAHAGRQAAPTPPSPRTAGPAPTPPGAPAPGSTPTPRGGSPVEFSDEDTGRLREQLGLPQDASAEAIVAAVLARPAAGTPQLPQGMTIISQDVLDEMRTDSAAGREARAQQQAEERERFMDAQVRRGAITRALRDSYLTQITPIGDGAAAAATRAMLEGLPSGANPVDEPRGYTNNGTGETSGGAANSLAEIRNDPNFQKWSVR